MTNLKDHCSIPKAYFARVLLAGTVASAAIAPLGTGCEPAGIMASARDGGRDAPWVESAVESASEDAKTGLGGDERDGNADPDAAGNSNGTADASTRDQSVGGESNGRSMDAGSSDRSVDTASNDGSAILAATPPMGWNSWGQYQGAVDDTVVRNTAAAMVSSGMAAAGYEYVIIDDTWQGVRDADGNIGPDTTRFPDMLALADYVHGLGLKFGLYSDRGDLTCAGYPGSYGHEVQDAERYASWGVDYLKYDNCNASPTSPGMQQDFATMANALMTVGRPIVYSICAWWFYDWEPSLGQLWRTTLDIGDSWSSLVAHIDRNGGTTSRYGSCTACSDGGCTSCFDGEGGACNTCSADVPGAVYAPPGLAPYSSPGHWNDPDTLQTGNGGMSDIEYRSQFSLWAIMAAPLIAGNDLTAMTPATIETLTNPEVIAVDQDPGGVQGQPVSESTVLEVWSKPLAQKGAYAVALFNRTDDAADISVAWSALGMSSDGASVRDLWLHEDLGIMLGGWTAPSVPSHGVVMLRVVEPTD